MKTTLNAIRAHGPCTPGWGRLLRHLGKTQADDEPLRIAEIVESNGLDDALWCLRAVTGHDKGIRLFAVWCARQVQHLMTDPRSLNALDVAERFANGEATAEELKDARYAARDAAGNASWAAYDAARDAAWDAAYAAANDAAWAANDAASAASAASVAAWDAQKSELLRICAEIEAREEA